MRWLCAGLLALAWSTPALASETITYTYDAQGRLVTVVHSGTVNNGLQTQYTPDNADNRTRKTTTGSPNG